LKAQERWIHAPLTLLFFLVGLVAPSGSAVFTEHNNILDSGCSLFLLGGFRQQAGVLLRARTASSFF
jgi:hypothetical protein